MWPPVSNPTDEPSRTYVRRVEVRHELPPLGPARPRVEVLRRVLRKVFRHVLRMLLAAGKLVRRASRRLGR
jgi:hypothetical protein